MQKQESIDTVPTHSAGCAAHRWR